MGNIRLNEILNSNKIRKINKMISKMMTKYSYHSTNYSAKDDIYKSAFTFVCPEHGSFTLTGAQLRLGKICPECHELENKEIIKHFNILNQVDRVKLLETKFKNYTFSDNKSIELDNTIRPECKYHGEFLTTPRKLLDPDIKDSCKWCDGIEMDQDGNSLYILNRVNRLKERQQLNINKHQNLSLKNIRLFDSFNIIETYLSDDNRLVSYNYSLAEFININKGYGNYSQYLKTLREPSYHNSIFFKLNITDKSTKFQFSIVHAIYLNETWNNWYKECLMTMDADIAQDYATKYIISEWYHAVVYGRAEGQLNKKEVNFDFEISHYQWSVETRTKLLVEQYKENNTNKLLELPEAIASKIYYNLSDIGVSVYWSENQWETTATSVGLIRETLLKKDNLCPICNKPIKDPVVDHEHKKKIRGSGRIRDNICSTCNVFIAKTENNCRRYKIDLEELPQVLKNVSDYFSQQQYNVIHYTEKDKRPTLNKSTAAKVLKYWEVLYPNKKKPKIPRSGVMTNDWQEYTKALEAYLENPYPTLNKLTYNKLVSAIVNYNDTCLERIKNEKMAKSRQPKLIPIPVYSKLKVRTPEIESLLKQFNI